MRVMATLCLVMILGTPAFAAPVQIGEESVVPVNPRSEGSRYVNWRPADGEVVDLNPPRMSWFYNVNAPEDFGDALHTFTLQIADNPQFNAPVVDVVAPFNFYNLLPALDPASTWYWRVGYDIGEEGGRWSDTRSFTIAPGATVWDRSALVDPGLETMGHPRVLLREDRMDEIRALAQTDEGARDALEFMAGRADSILEQPWWIDFPQTDRAEEPERHFWRIAEDLAIVAFVWKITEDDRYAGVVERAVTWASYPPGGGSSPEYMGGDDAKRCSYGNEYLALMFDWLYHDMTEEQRAVMIESLEWRVDHQMNRIAWRGHDGPSMRLRFDDDSRGRPDQRLYLEPSVEWTDFEWEIWLSQKTSRIQLSVHGPRTEWDDLYFGAAPDGPNLLEDGEFVRSRMDVEQPGTYYMRGRYRTEEAPSDRSVRGGSLSGQVSSHPFEGSMVTAVAGLVLYEHSEIGREWFELMLNYLIGVTCGYGFDEAWNEGAGYGSSKNKWLTNASLYFDTTIPGANLGLNPYYSRLGSWLRRIIPVGMDHHAWGNMANASRGGHLATFRKLGFMTGDGQFIYNWRSYGGETFNRHRPWIEYVLPAFYEEPEARPESDTSEVFQIAGWAMAASGPPSAPATYAEGTGVILQCRARGGYGHSFNSDGSVQLHAYGEMLNHGGGTVMNLDHYPFHTMSHNVVMIDGLGQAQPPSGMLHPTYGHIAGYDEGELADGGRYVYFAADPTNAYPKEPGSFRRWSFPLEEPYTERALPHLESYVRHVLYMRDGYFVIFDDLRTSQPATFTWLWHILQDHPLDFEYAEDSFVIRYRAGGVPVRLHHIARPNDLELDNRRGLDGRVNPFTGEDYRDSLRGNIVEAHNLWISNREPEQGRQFLAVIYPEPPGGEIPTIERIDDRTVRVGDDVICFDPTSPAAAEADIVVEIDTFVSD